MNKVKLEGNRNGKSERGFEGLRDFERKVLSKVFDETLDAKAAVFLSEEEVVWAYNDDKSVEEAVKVVVKNWINHLTNC